MGKRVVFGKESSSSALGVCEVVGGRGESMSARRILIIVVSRSSRFRPVEVR